MCGWANKKFDNPLRANRLPWFFILVVFTAVISLSAFAQDSISYSKDIYPILKKRCLKCHERDDENPSNFAMDTYQLMRSSGTTENIIVPGNAMKSYLCMKIMPNPPKGGQMPLFSKKKLSKEEIDMIVKWIDQGAKDN